MQIPTDSPLYAKAFTQYLRSGTPIEISLKALMDEQQRVTPRYVWLTSGDERVRASHAANDGKIFDWDDPPPTGHPGADYGCRCVAVPYADTREAALIAFAITPLIRGRVLASRVLREAIRRAWRREEPPAPKPAEPPPLPKPEGIPRNWGRELADKKEGIRYVDPKNRGNDVRIQRGNPNSQYPNQRGDYVRWKKNGQWLDKNGRPSIDKEKTHIPLDEFIFKPELFK
jgi:GNAT superfamily N-acetyltransferase